jgi:hypothetical protein
VPGAGDDVLEVGRKTVEHPTVTSTCCRGDANTGGDFRTCGSTGSG